MLRRKKQELYCIVSFPATKGTTGVVPTTTNKTNTAKNTMITQTKVHNIYYLWTFLFLLKAPLRKLAYVGSLVTKLVSTSLKAVKRQKSQKIKRIG